ncbi:MAG: glutaredoxin domain-containing protein [Pseudoxanthomonas suwonensis]|nr:glutaredoxin domain-containing protein [Pseudoxanthomonas suwonensis]
MRNGLILLGVLVVVIGGWLAFGQAPREGDPRRDTGEDGIVMLAADWCGYCRRQQAEFKQAGVEYVAIDVDTFEGQRAMQALGAHGVPVTVIGQNVVRGYDTVRLQRHLSPLGYDVYRAPHEDI